MYKTALLCLLLITLSTNVDADKGGRPNERGRGPGRGRHKNGVFSIIDPEQKDILTRTPAGTRAAKGNACTTPFGVAGVCAYITDPPCESILRLVSSRGVTRQIVSYLQKAIQSPCGFDVTDYTMCCEGGTPNPPTTASPVAITTTPSPVPPPPEKTPCGFFEQTRIVGGTESKAGAWPWAVIVGKPKDGGSFQVMCGGTLISSVFILTAAHCFVGITSPATHVRLGEHDISTTADGVTIEDVAIKKITTHEGYTTTALQNDIAILELERPVAFRAGVRPACLPDQFAKFDLSTLARQPTIVGWGSTTTGGTTVNALRQATVPLVAGDVCKTDYAPVSRLMITDNQICAGTGTVDTCAGDSGGPMLSDQFGRYAVIGITSFGVKCGDPTFPGVYTRVDKFLDWIASKTV